MAVLVDGFGVLAVLGLVVVGAALLEVVVAGLELVVRLIELEVGGATVTVVNTMAGRVAVVRAGVDRPAVGRVGTGFFGVMARLLLVEVVAGAAGGDVVVPDAGDDDAACMTEISTGAVSLTGADLLISGDETAELPVGAADCSCAWRLRITTTPISTPTVALRAAAVSTTTAFPGTAPSPSAPTGHLLGSLWHTGTFSRCRDAPDRLFRRGGRAARRAGAGRPGGPPGTEASW